jgi:hypothetical protein
MARIFQTIPLVPFGTFTDTSSVPVEHLYAAHASLRDVAQRLAGDTCDASKRASLYYRIFEDSRGNFSFPLIASHGSMWGVTHTLAIERQLRRLLPLSRHGRLQGWIDALDVVRDINRRVFVEIYTTFYFTWFYGSHPAAGDLIKPALLALYNEVHGAVEMGRHLSRADRQRIYYDVFVHEQNDIVDPGIQAAIRVCGSSPLVYLLKRVSPRFRYFPRHERLYFSDFTSVDQRNREGLRAFGFAEEVGADRVYEALSEYR